RRVPAAEATEVAHECAVELMTRPPDQLTRALIFVVVNNRIRNRWRASHRRDAAESAYGLLATRTPVWADPAAALDEGELRRHIDASVAAMSVGAREVFLLVRDDGLSYKEVAARLGVSVSTVHTQLSRANALLRECVRRYRAGEPPAS